MAILVGLGVWQLQRLAWKERILAEITARMDDALPALPAAPDETRDEYRRVRLTGQIEAGEVHVLTSQPPAGPGYLVIAPLALPDGRRVMVQRGFVPEAGKPAPRPGGRVTVDGNILWPDDRNPYTPAPNAERNIWFARDVAPMAAALGTEPLLVVAREAIGPGLSPAPVSVNIANDHLGYALTWFGLAAVWAAMTVGFLRTRRRAAA